MKKFYSLILIIVFGGLSGILASQFFMPYLAHTSPFDKISWLKQVKNGTTIINKTEQVTIEESTAIEDSIGKISPSVVGIIAKSKASAKNKKTAAETNIYGTGFIVTSDGLVLADGILTDEKNFNYFVVKGGETFPAAITKKDAIVGLALLKIEQTNLPVVSFVDFDSLKLGQRVILAGLDASQNPAGMFVDLGIIKSIANNIFSISIEKESPKASGAPIINDKGEVIGMAQVNTDNSLKIVTAETIKEFLKE